MKNFIRVEEYMIEMYCAECGKIHRIDMRGEYVKRKHKAWVDCECGLRFSVTRLKLRRREE